MGTPIAKLPALAACAGLLLAACARTEPETALRGQVAALQEAVEAREPAAIRRLLSEDFIGPGGMDRERAVRTARLAFLRHRQVGATVAGPLQVALRERDATVSFEVALTGGSGRLLPDAVRLYSVETGWRLEEGDWRLLSASWEPRL